MERTPYFILCLPQKEVHEEYYAEEKHGQPAANLSDIGERVQVRTGEGFIKRSLQKAKIKHF